MENSMQPIHPISKNDTDRIADYPDAMLLGLTKREYFAAMAMQGMLSNQAFATGTLPHGLSVEQMISNASLIYANALLLELEK